MIPASITGRTIDEITPLLDEGDIIIDGGNSNYRDDVRRGKKLREQGIHYVDIGTSGGVFGLERGYCLMVGGAPEAIEIIDPILKTIAPGPGEIERTPGRDGDLAPEEQGYLHCGPSGAGHFVKMVHNGIEYGIMAAYAEGLNILDKADIGNTTAEHSAEVAPMEEAEYYQFDINTAKVTELWRRGSVVSSWLLDLTAAALQENPDARRASPAGSPTRARVAGPSRPRWTSACRYPCSPPPCSSGSPRGTRTSSPTRCSPRCGCSSAATRSCRPGRSWRPAPRRPTRWRTPQTPSSVRSNGSAA